MDSKKTKSLIIAAIILVVGALCSLVSTVIIIGEPDTNMYFLLLTNLAALVFALWYMISGFRKQDANKYKCFLISYSISVLMAIVANAKIMEYYPAIGTLGTISFAIVLGAVMVLGIARDLGKKISMAFASECLIIVSLMLVLTLALVPGIFNGKDAIATVYYFGVIRQFSLTFVLYICTKAKYIDKDSRGTI